MTTCKSNNKPLYTISANSYGRDFNWEWQQMGSQTVDPQFVLTNLNMGGSINGKQGSISGNNNTLNEIIKKNSPYVIYKSTTSDQLYYYDKTKIPIDCSTPTLCQDTCSGYTDYDSKGAIGDRHKYYSVCNKGGGMFCIANNNYMGNIRDCNGEKRDYAVPQPYCSSSYNTKGFGYSFNNGMECSETPYTPTYGILRESSVSALNNSSKPCLNPPCCPLTHKEAYVYNKPNSDEKIRLCYNSVDGKDYSCNPKGSSDLKYPSCSTPYIPNNKYNGNSPPINTNNSIESIGDCKNICNNRADCGLFQYDSNTGVCDLFPLITPTDLNTDNNIQLSKGTILGLDYKKDWILDRTFDTGVIPTIVELSSKDINNNVNGCYTACINKKECNAFTYDPLTAQSCKLFNSAPEIPSKAPGAISLKISNPNAYRTANNYINDPQSTVSQAYKVVNENFQSAIENVQLNKNIEHMMTLNNAKGVVSNCNPTDISQSCTKAITNIFKPTSPNIQLPSFSPSQQPCPATHPYPINGGKECAYESYRLSEKEGRGVIVSKNNDIKPCPNKGGACTQYTAFDINNYTSTGKTLNSDRKSTNGCLIDMNMQNNGYKIDNNQYVCDAGKQCIGYAHDIVNGNINSNTSTPGYCSDHPSLQSHSYGKSRGGTPIQTFASVSPDHCSYSCKQKAECRSWNFNPNSRECTLQSNATTLNPSSGTVSSLKISDFNTNGQNACEKQLNNISNISEVHYIGNNSNANDLFNTTGSKGSNLIELPSDQITLGPGHPNGWKCVSNPLGWNNDKNAQWWYAKTDDTSNNEWVEGKTCLAASDYFDGQKLYKKGTPVPFNTASCVAGSTETECNQRAQLINKTNPTSVGQKTLYTEEACGPGPGGPNNFYNNADNGRCYKDHTGVGLQKAKEICENNERCGGITEVCGTGGDGCVFEPQFSQLMPQANKNGYKISRHQWVTTKVNDPNIDGYCAYKT